MKKHITFEYQDGPYTEKLVLKAYSPGDGALALNCVNPSDTSGNVAPFKASEQDILKLRDTHFPDFGILKQGEKHPQYRFYKPVERVSDNELKIEGKVYRYEPEFDRQDISSDIQRYRLFADVRFGEGEPQNFEVKNLSTVGSANFYIKNEEAILASKKEFCNEVAFAMSQSGKGREQRMAGLTP